MIFKQNKSKCFFIEIEKYEFYNGIKGTIQNFGDKNED